MTTMKTPPGIGIAHFLDFAIERTPQKTAILDDETSLTFADVDVRANRLAVAFRRAGVSPGDRAAIILPNVAPHIIAEIAAARCGLVKVPLNIRFHLNEVLYALVDCEPAVLVCDQSYAEAIIAKRHEIPSLRALFSIGRKVAGAELFDEILATETLALDRVRYRPDDPVLIRYTGGTTGRPKGIVHTELSYLNCALDCLREIPIRGEDVALHLGHLSHGLNFIWPAFFSAGSTQILRERFEPRRVLEDFERHKISFVYMVPTMVQRLLREDDGTADVSSLRTFFYGSAIMPVPVLRQAIERFGPIFMQVYTLSESPVLTTIMRPEEHIDKMTSVGPRLASCGRPVVTMELRLLGDDGQPVSGGDVGEIAVRSINNMAEYWRLPDQTAETLVDGWVMTGDMARRDEDGFYYVVDRKKDVIITGAFNVYPKEVEDVLYRHPAVAQCVVVGVPDEEWGEAIKAYIVLKSGTHASPNELIELCRDNLASYKKPRHLEFVESLPLTPVGKIMRRALKQS
jgi:fatty-acyl-CoA synthase/long-chain acyl-CoA synthetase